MKLKMLLGLFNLVLVSACLEATEIPTTVHSVRETIQNINSGSENEVALAKRIEGMFTHATLSGSVRTMYAGYDQKESSSIDTYSTAVGGALKYELAGFKGFNAGVQFSTSHDMDFISGDRDQGRNNAELSSSNGNYTQLSEAYVNYKLNDFNFRAGRQTIDTPLADSDDIRIVKNSFDAYIATYSYKGVEFMLGNLQKWQGTDAGLDDGWVDAGVDGTNFGGISYANIFEFNAWYYNITKSTNAFYVDTGVNYPINKNFTIHTMVQYLDEKELDKSGTAAHLYGALLELSIYDFDFGIAYNKSDKVTNKSSFSGFGGGVMFTSMDTSIIDDIATDRDVDVIVGGLTYHLEDFSFLYAYGDFNGAKDSAGTKVHTREQDVSLEYNMQDKVVLSAIYVLKEDRLMAVKSDNDWSRMQVNLTYNF